MEYHIIELSNGIRGVLKRMKSPVIYSAITIGAGSCDEMVNEYGAAHFLEHMFFKGTERRRQYHINSLLDNVGGELNAYTTKEETVVHSALLKGDFKKSVDLMSDVVFNSQLLNSEIEKERVVIVDEINTYKDSPSDQIFDNFEDLIFKDSSLGHPILGTKQSLKGIDHKKLSAFKERCYNCDKIIFSVIGNVTPERFRDVAECYLSQIPSNNREWSREELSPYNISNIELSKRTHQSHILMGNRAYSHTHKDRLTLLLLTNILGGQSPSSRLNQLLREKNGLTYNVEAIYNSYEKGGLFNIYVSCDSERRERCIELIKEEMKKLRDNRLSEYMLSRFKKQFIGQIAIASDNSENLMLSSARSLLLYGSIDSFDTIKNRVDMVTTSDILRVSNEILDFNNFSTLIYK